ncbi:MAG: DUF5615 family PIN-like protein [Anaerolineae bacterium]|nr:DUF5615 family PIN-like protein [Anaerolineae bacterium]
MSSSVRFHLDEHVPTAVAKALRRRGIDVTTTVDVGLRQADDLAHLKFAAKEGRVIVTHDADFLRHHAQGIEHSGIAYCHKDARTIGQIIETLRLIHDIMTAEEMVNAIEYL